jgi:hypothetical protein
MFSWVLSCLNRKNAFEHSKIDDYKLSDFLDPQKPPVLVEGALAQYLNWGDRSLYRRMRFDVPGLNKVRRILIVCRYAMS